MSLRKKKNKSEKGTATKGTPKKICKKENEISSRRTHKKNNATISWRAAGWYRYGRKPAYISCLPRLCTPPALNPSFLVRFKPLPHRVKEIVFQAWRSWRLSLPTS